MDLPDDSLQEEHDGFSLKYFHNQRTGRNEFVLMSTTAGRHKAVYTHFNLLSDDGTVIDTPQISDVVAKFIFRNFDLRGPTESFNVFRSDLETGVFKAKAATLVAPSDVRHTRTSEESSFTATGDKLDYHWPVFRKYQETGYGSIIRATLTLHQVCSSHCHYCSTISRNRRDSISLKEAKEFVETLYNTQAEFNRTHFAQFNTQYREINNSDIRLRGLILSGGGQPNLWPHFAEFVEWLSGYDIDLGLITNGFPKNVPDDVYRHFKWIRLSITPEDASPFYPNQRFDLQYLPELLRNSDSITTGFSYVYGPWTTDDIILRIDRATIENGFRYARFLTDCNLTRQSQLAAHMELAERLHRLNLTDASGNPLTRIFHQLKYHGTHEEAHLLWDQGQCFLQTYNVFWDTTGHEEQGYSYCYPCDSVTVLAEEGKDGAVLTSERRFDQYKWGTVTNKDVRRLFSEKVHPYFDPRANCSACLFMKNNLAVKRLTERADWSNITLNDKLEHRNFP